MNENQEIMTDEAAAEAVEAEAVTEEVGASDAPASGEDSEALRAEIDRLRGEVTRLNELQQRSRAELDEFCALFPNVSPLGLPSEVRAQVENGVPLAAAYALYEKREACRAAAGKRSAEHSWRGMGAESGGEYYSPSEVRAMSQKEVHKNYKKIIESMKHWK